MCRLFRGIPVFEEPQLRTVASQSALLPVAESGIPPGLFVRWGGIHTHYDSFNLQLLSKLSAPAYSGRLWSARNSASSKLWIYDPSQIQLLLICIYQLW